MVKSILPYIVACIFLFGLSTFFRKLAIDRMHPYQLQVISGTIYLGLLPMWVFFLSKKENIHYEPLGILYAIICIAFYTGGAVLFGFLLKDTKNPGMLTALASLSPIVTIGLTFFFLGEKFTLAKGIAFLLALASAILVNF